MSDMVPYADLELAMQENTRLEQRIVELERENRLLKVGANELARQLAEVGQ